MLVPSMSVTSVASRRRHMSRHRRANRSRGAAKEYPELLRELTRVHESTHVVLGHLGGLRIEGATSRHGNAYVSLNVPQGQPARSITWSHWPAAAQRRFGATDAHYEEACRDDDRQIREMAEKLAKTHRDVERIIGAVQREAEKLVARHWGDILYIKGALRQLGDRCQPR
jgi:hypothetical protein